jgi:hypothetical protein
MTARTAARGAEALHAALRADGGTVAEVLVDGGSALGAPQDPPGPAQIAAGGPRCAGREGDYELLLEMILEGSRLHYGQPRVVRPDDQDLALLLGDQLYALGLSRLAALGDLDAISELADVISLVAQAHAASNPLLAERVWEAGATAIGWGSSEALRRAQALARAEDPHAGAALRRAAGVLRDAGNGGPSS